MDPIKVDDPPMLLQRTLSPGFKLFGERLVEATDGTVDWELLPSGFRPLLPRMSGTCPGYEHLG